jgi:hypothetical protein
MFRLSTIKNKRQLPVNVIIPTPANRNPGHSGRWSPMRVPSLLVLLLAAGLDLMGQIPTEVSGLQQAAEIDVGWFCLTDIPRGMIVVKDSWLQPDGLWRRLEIKVPASAARKPNALFFKSTRKPKTGGVLTKCADDWHRQPSRCDTRSRANRNSDRSEIRRFAFPCRRRSDFRF